MAIEGLLAGRVDRPKVVSVAQEVQGRSNAEVLNTDNHRTPIVVVAVGCDAHRVGYLSARVVCVRGE